jgi:hypothetical protein
MTSSESTPTRSPSTALVGGTALVAAGLLQLFSEVRFVIPATQEAILPLWTLAGWIVAAALLLWASVRLAQGRRGEVGIVGRPPIARSALIVSGGSSVLLTALAALALVSGSASTSPSAGAIEAEQVVVLAATAASAVFVSRARVLAGIARWAFVPIAVVDAVSVVLHPVAAWGVAWLACAFVVRPAVVVVAGVALLWAGTSGGFRASSAARMRRK